MSDHGTEAKGTLYQQGARILNFVRYPVEFGTEGPIIMPSDFMASTVDLAPTIFDAAGVDAPAEYVMDGASYLDHTDESDDEPPHQDPNPDAVSDFDYKYIDVFRSHSIVSARWQNILMRSNVTEYMEVIELHVHLMSDYIDDICIAANGTECVKPGQQAPTTTTTTTTTLPPDVDCLNDDHCGRREVCEEGECVDSAPQVAPCNVTADCGNWKICTADGECQNERVCWDDVECLEHQTCEEGYCVRVPSKGCDSDADCND